MLLIALMSPMSPAVAADDSLQRVIAAKVLKVGVAPNAPWVIKKPDGSFAGHDIDLVEAFAEDLGVTAQFVEMPFADLVPRLAKGDVDMIAAGIAITPERARSVAFSAPTGMQEIGTVADRKALGTDPATALEKPSFRIAVLAKSTDEAAARNAFPKASVVTYPTAAAALAALIDGQAQAMVATSPVPRMAASLYDAKLRLIGGPLERTGEAFAFRPDDVRLLTYANNWIAARQIDGFIGNVGTHWFDGHKWLRAAEGDLKPQRAAR
ncbi:transporter substrate-binding domain-containing protein [Sphingomonas sp. DT-204]